MLVRLIGSSKLAPNMKVNDFFILFSVSLRWTGDLSKVFFCETETQQQNDSSPLIRSAVALTAVQMSFYLIPALRE